MKKLILVLSIFASISSFASEHATITINESIEISNFNDLAQSYKSYVKLENSKCSIYYTSLTPVILNEGQIISGTVVTLDRAVSKDSDEIGKRSTSQFTFTSDNGNLEITAACFGAGILFPRLGLPSLKELLEIAKPQLTLSEE
jgi:hypothetical protein